MCTFILCVVWCLIYEKNIFLNCLQTAVFLKLDLQNKLYINMYIHWYTAVFVENSGICMQFKYMTVNLYST